MIEWKIDKIDAIEKEFKFDVITLISLPWIKIDTQIPHYFIDLMHNMVEMFSELSIFFICFTGFSN